MSLEDTLEDERKREAELKFWREMALYMMDCHAATAQYDGILKSTSKSRRKRFRSICENAARWLEHGYMTNAYPVGSKESILSRLKDAVVELSDHEVAKDQT